MSYHFAPHRKVAADVRRLIASQLVAAAGIISRGQDANAVHDTRVRIKRTRALLDMLAGNDEAGRLEAELRQAASRLAEAREAETLMIDATHLKAHRTAASLCGQRGAMAA